MSYLIVCVTAFCVAGLTLISGFGLGTLLLPAFILFFPVEIAVAATAAVHLLNNLFKLFLVGKHADRQVVLLFAVPAAVGALFGAFLLVKVAESTSEYTVSLFGQSLEFTPVNTLIGVLMFFFGLVELVPAFGKFQFGKKYIPIGGVISGFFGGVSGHQGAMRAAFLINTGLNKEQFIGTSVLCAIVVDISRIAVYGVIFYGNSFSVFSEGNSIYLVIVATGAAFFGSYIGSRLMKKVTLRSVQIIVGCLLILIALLLITGII